MIYDIDALTRAETFRRSGYGMAARSRSSKARRQARRGYRRAR